MENEGLEALKEQMKTVETKEEAQAVFVEHSYEILKFMRRYHLENRDNNQATHVGFEATNAKGQAFQFQIPVSAFE